MTVTRTNFTAYLASKFFNVSLVVKQKLPTLNSKFEGLSAEALGITIDLREEGAAITSY